MIVTRTSTALLVALLIVSVPVFAARRPTIDTTPPTVSIIAPAADATVSGSQIAVSALAWDNKGVSGVQFLVDGSWLGSEDRYSPWGTTWNTTTTTNGQHMLQARARDAAGNIGMSAAVYVTVSNNAPPPTSNWILTWSDEFDGTSLDTVKWITTYPDGYRTNNDELEWYMDDAEYHVVSNGTLKLVAKNVQTNSGYPYTSGMICSYEKFQQAYGRFETRMKLPAGRGLWPAFWLVPYPLQWPPEIDVMENLGNDTHTIYMTNHYSANYPYGGEPYGGSEGISYYGPYGGEPYGGSEGISYYGLDYSAGFHTFAVEWDSSKIVWFVDGVARFSTTNKVPLVGYGIDGMYLILNLAVGGSWPGAPDASTVFPATLEIDYVRVYTK
jgi:beta-glucanase (GH16 family)